MFTAGQSEITTVEIAVSTSNSVRAIASDLPKCAPQMQMLGALNANEGAPVDLSALAGGEGLRDGKIQPGNGTLASAAPMKTASPVPPCADGLTIVVAKDGFAIKAKGGNVSPGCGDVGAGLAIPSHDKAALRACAVKLRDAVGFDTSSPLTVTASA